MESILKTDNIFKGAESVAIVMQEKREETDEKTDAEKLIIRLCKNDPEGEFLWSRLMLEFTVPDSDEEAVKEILNKPGTLIITDEEATAKYLKTDFGIEKDIHLLSDLAKAVLNGYVEEDVLLESLFDVASVFYEYEDLRTFDSHEWSEAFRRIINFLLHFKRLTSEIKPRNEHSQFTENLMEFILDKPELSIAGVHMYEDKDGKMYFMAVKEPFETIYLETTEESAFDDLYQFMEETDVICGYGLSDEITFFINKTCMDKGRIPSYRVIDIKDLLYELYEVSDEAEKDLNYIYVLNRFLVKPGFLYLYSKPGLELPLKYIDTARKMCDDYKNRKN